MPRPRLQKVSIEQVKIDREGDTAVFTYADSSLGGGLHLKMGKKIHKMTDDELLECHNNMIENMDYHRRQYEYVAKEIPIGKPQIEFSKTVGHWTARGDVIRCCIGYQDNPELDDREPLIEIDNHKLSWREFGKMLTTYEGWGMRVVIVPDDELHEKPKIKIAEPKQQKDIPFNDEQET